MTNQIANFQLIKTLIDSEISAYQIEDKTGVSRNTIGKMRNGKAKIENMALASAIALTAFAENQINIKANELLDRMKHSKAFDYVIYTDKDKSRFLRNTDTVNFQCIFNDREEEYHIYGVYGDCVNGQVDSSKNTDEEIKQALVTILSLGNITNRP